MSTREKIQNDPLTTKKSKKSGYQSLILFNDDVNSFDFVIESLVEICGHDYIQAEQCAMIAHFKGKCEIKTGDYPTLRPMRLALLRKGLSSVIA